MVVALVLMRLLGWHWALLPSLVAEMVPGLNLVPTWTAAVLYLTRGGAEPAPPASLPGGTDAQARAARDEVRKP
ncbi:MAG TPA: hypothetical protein VN375_12750 [Vicinamibacteria bacterium]|nr:hypothetical protein [Vicinamibacteria bacterium]